MDIPSLFMIPSAVSSGKVHSVFPNSTDADFDFNRDSDATRVNSEGLIERVGFYGSELAPAADFAADFVANPSSGTVVNSPNGTLTFTNSTSSGANVQLKNRSVTTTKTYKIQFTITNYVAGTFKMSVGNQISNAASANGTYIFYIEYTSGLNRNYFYTNNSTLTVSNISVKEVLGDRARLNYEIGGGLVNTKPSLLLEPQSTNLITYSEDYSQSSWTKLNAQVSRTDETSPDGNNTNVFNLTGTNGNLFVGGTTGVEYTISVYIKSNNKNKDKFKLRLGNNISTEYEATDEWIRYVFTSTPTTGVFGITTSSSPDNEFDLLVWGFQLEQLSYATSYIPTNGSTQTRAAETCNGAGTSSILPTQGILFLEAKALVDGGVYREVILSDGSSNNTVRLRYSSDTSRFQASMKSGGGTIQSLSRSAKSQDIYRKVALEYNPTEFAMWIDGTKEATVTTTSIPVAISELNFSLNGSFPFYGKIRDIRVYNTKEMTDSEVDILLTKITS
tara:strand:+ start:1533 stop:3044 length:1512 start_codon:yes stop_codon:yes gene_type:complete